MTTIRVTAMRGSRDFDGPSEVATIEVPDDVADAVVDVITEAVGTATSIAATFGPFSGGVAAFIVE